MKNLLRCFSVAGAALGFSAAFCADAVPGFSVTGGDVVSGKGDFSDWIVHTFSDAFAGGIPLKVERRGAVRVLLVGGGGGGGTGVAAGGGGGGGVVETEVELGPGDYIVKVGAGGAGAVSANGDEHGANGGASEIVKIDQSGAEVSSVAIAHGGGGGGSKNTKGCDGASGGGAGGYVDPKYGETSGPKPADVEGGAAVFGTEGFAGGDSSQTTRIRLEKEIWYSGGGGGGGGAGGSGLPGIGLDAANAIYTGNGGPGVASALLRDLFGEERIFGGGGGGGAVDGNMSGKSGAPGGVGGGGAGGDTVTGKYCGKDGTAGTGGGGGGSSGHTSNSDRKGGDGGSGFVAIAYRCGSPLSANLPPENRCPGRIDGYRLYRFDASSAEYDFEVTKAGIAEVFLLGGGGGGGAGGDGAGDGAGGGAGGGGGGGVLLSKMVFFPGTYRIAVGAGGAGGTNGSHGENGQPSAIYRVESGVVAEMLSAQGGGGGGGAKHHEGMDGATGGGAAGYINETTPEGKLGGNAVYGAQGFRGGDATAGERTKSGVVVGFTNGGGGGGGAGERGADSAGTLDTFIPGVGGNGVECAWTGTAVVYGGGGGGGHNWTLGASGAAGGLGGGGKGGDSKTNLNSGENGADGLGGGGGGASGYSPNGSPNPKGGNGGSGLVLLRFVPSPKGLVVCVK